MVRRFIDAFLRGEASGPLVGLLRVPLLPAAVLYGGGAAVRASRYKRGILRRRRLPIPVVSVGNLTVGGTGKTPFVRALARRLIDGGHRPLILSRGYGARAASGLDEEGASLQRDLPDARVAQAPDRFGAAQTHLDEQPAFTVAILDDGAQAMGLHRDLEIILVDATRPFGCGWPLPAGALREPRGAIGRADLVVVTRSGELDQVGRDRLVEALSRAGLDGDVAWAVHQADRLLPGGMALHELEGKRIYLLSGIAAPESFASTVRGLGGVIVGEQAYGDHHAFRMEELSSAALSARDAGAELILATGKDEPKLSGLGPTVPPLCFLEVIVRLDPDGDVLLDGALKRLLRPPADPS